MDTRQDQIRGSTRNITKSPQPDSENRQSQNAPRDRIAISTPCPCAVIPTRKFLRRYDNKGPRERTTSPRRCGSGTPHPAVSRKIQRFPAVFVMDNSHLFPQRRRVSDCLGLRRFGCLSQMLGCLCFADHVHNGRSVGDGHGLRDSVRAVLGMTTAAARQWYNSCGSVGSSNARGFLWDSGEPQLLVAPIREIAVLDS